LTEEKAKGEGAYGKKRTRVILNPKWWKRKTIRCSRKGQGKNCGWCSSHQRERGIEVPFSLVKRKRKGGHRGLVSKKNRHVETERNNG